MLEWNLQTIVAVILAAIALYILWQSGLGSASVNLDQRMEEFADQAVKQAKSEYHCDLDYSLDSIRFVDTILQSLHVKHQSNPILEKELSRLVLTWGGYIGVVLKKHYGGTWRTDSDESGHHTYPIQWKDHEAVPVIWSLRQIRYGTEASVKSKFDAFVPLLRETRDRRIPVDPTHQNR